MTKRGEGRFSPVRLVSRRRTCGTRPRLKSPLAPLCERGDCKERPPHVLKGGLSRGGSVIPSQGLQGRRFFCSPLSRFLGKWGQAPAGTVLIRNCPPSVPEPVPIFMMQHLLSDDNVERARLAVGCGNLSILLLPPVKIDGSERDPRLPFSTEIALAPLWREGWSEGRLTRK